MKISYDTQHWIMAYVGVIGIFLLMAPNPANVSMFAAAKFIISGLLIKIGLSGVSE